MHCRTEWNLVRFRVDANIYIYMVPGIRSLYLMAGPSVAFIFVSSLFESFDGGVPRAKARAGWRPEALFARPSFKHTLCNATTVWSVEAGLSAELERSTVEG